MAEPRGPTPSMKKMYQPCSTTESDANEMVKVGATSAKTVRAHTLTLEPCERVQLVAQRRKRAVQLVAQRRKRAVASGWVGIRLSAHVGDPAHLQDGQATLDAAEMGGVDRHQDGRLDEVEEPVVLGELADDKGDQEGVGDTGEEGEARQASVDKLALLLADGFQGRLGDDLTAGPVPHRRVGGGALAEH
eukprot:6926018-Prymnesium_polylepis.1